MLRKKQGPIEWLEFQILQSFPHVKHATFKRHGGVSRGKYDSLNFSDLVLDYDSNFKKNIALAQAILDFDTYVKATCVHGDEQHVIKAHQRGNIGKGDALITGACQKALLTTHADCQVAIIYDPMHDVLASVHAGWRGQTLEIYTKTIETLKKLYGSKPEDLIVCISPSLGPKFSEFTNYQVELPETWKRYWIGQCHFNLWDCAEHELLLAGIQIKNIEIARICTYENRDFFSYRRDKGVTGRCGTFAFIDKS